MNASILIVVDFGFYPRALANIRKDVVALYAHVVESFFEDEGSHPFESHTCFFSLEASL